MVMLSWIYKNIFQNYLDQSTLQEYFFSKQFDLALQALRDAAPHSVPINPSVFSALLKTTIWEWGSEELIRLLCEKCLFPDPEILLVFFQRMGSALRAKKPELANILFEGMPKYDENTLVTYALQSHILHATASTGYLDFTKKILQLFPTALETEDNVYNKTALSFAAEAGQTEVIEYLLTYQANIDAVTNNFLFKNYAAVHFAALNNHASVVQQLIKAKAFLDNKVGLDDGHIIHVSAQKDALNVLKLLLAHQPNYLYKKNKHNETAMHIAAKYHRLSALQLLATYDPKVLNEADNTGKTPLMIAAADNNLPMIEFLTSHATVNLNQVDKNGETACHHGFRSFQYKNQTLAILANAKADLGKKNLRGRSVLGEAIHAYDIKRATELVSHYRSYFAEDELTAYRRLTRGQNRFFSQGSDSDSDHEPVATQQLAKKR